MLDAIEFEIMYRNLVAIADEMGVVLQKSSYSPNIRERLDASCAVYSRNKDLIAQAEHIPVHLGSMHIPLRYIDHDLAEGDQVIVNDPSKGGTHLPDITIYKPVFHLGTIVAYVGNRAHHADIGGITPGSIPGNSTEIYQEGLIIPPVKFMEKGHLNRDVSALILANTRTPIERRGDLMAQVGANNHGTKNLDKFISRYGIEKFLELDHEILEHTKRMVTRRLEILPKGTFTGSDLLEANGELLNIQVNIEITENDNISIDFTGTSDVCKTNLNAPLAVTLSAVYFFFRTILGGDVPVNSAFYDFFDITVPEGSMINAPARAPVVGGNVETSQRLVDAMLNAFAGVLDIPAQAHGTMNNVSFGNGRFTFYETLGGGSGGSSGTAGVSGVHVYMTNTKNTPVEVMEATYPLECIAYSLLTGTGGNGEWPGGDGIIKHYKALEPCTFSIISGRRKVVPKGRNGGAPGAIGENYVIKNGRKERIDGKAIVQLNIGDEIIVMTPGGGGYGEY